MLIVKKFGGTSVANKERIFNVASRCIEEYRKGNDVVVVLSAMGKYTDELITMAKDVNEKPPKREMDMLFTIGEQMSVALMAMAMDKLGVPAVSLNAFQVSMHTTSSHGNARLKRIDTERIRRELDSKKIVIVTGFQGVDKYDDYTTLGRGGSDTTAVALAAALHADACEIYTDVDGVYTADPRKVPKARKLKEITYDEMLDLATLGAGVLHNRSVEMAKKYDRILSVCHVLRYSPFFSKLKELLEEGKIGRLMTIQHMEEVGYWHQAHSFVRGNWRNAEESSPMILQKCCHDMDIMLWLADSKCESLSSFGELSYFTEENAPEGAPAYCLDGCPHRDECAFYAPRFYLENLDGYLVRAVTDQTDPEHVLEALKKGPYGRCVFHCDNTVVDHQSVDIKFENQVTASFLMTAFTDQCARWIRLMGTKGEIKGDMDAGTIEIRDFVSGNLETIELHTPANGHNGSDMSMMHDFVRMVGEGRKGKTDAAVSVESHLMALAAEEARITGQVVNLRGFANENK